MKARFIHEENSYGELETGSTTLAFVAESLRDANGITAYDNRLAGLPAGAEIALVTPNVQAAYDQAIKAGATPLKPPHDMPWGQIISYVRDLNGFLVEICSKVG